MPRSAIPATCLAFAALVPCLDDFVLSQVPKCEGPGAPMAYEWITKSHGHSTSRRLLTACVPAPPEIRPSPTQAGRAIGRTCGEPSTVHPVNPR
jgi:hypothetical protein